MQKIISKENSLIKHIIKLKNKKYRNEFNEYIIEGLKLIKEAIQEKANIKRILITEETLNNSFISDFIKNELNNLECYIVTSAIIKLIIDVETPQGIVAVIEKNNILDLIDYTNDFILVLDDIQDPGNLGTIIRTADSCNIKQILVSKGTVDAFNPKVIRSTMGAIFRVSIIECENLAKTLENLKKNNYRIISTALDSSKSIYDINFKRTALVIGNEANGVSKPVLDITDEKAIIPMLGKTESLNASVAAGVIMYEYVRQKIQEKSWILFMYIVKYKVKIKRI